MRYLVVIYTKGGGRFQSEQEANSKQEAYHKALQYHNVGHSEVGKRNISVMPELQ